ncbi:MAG: hypothetical protein UT50_C0030G0009 [Candidatus Moranbacteria bacterium GW2011_GWA2_39_41]|nr:MAG: hypothetical protein UT50_C0030G0009 [Candidatus Moranbacteria bacterium GW2011_GWA2_39_41]
MFLGKTELKLPEQYRGYVIIKEENIDVDKDGRDERVAIISNMQEKYSSGDTKSIMIKKSGKLLEISGYGSELQWQQIGDFNNNGKIDIATLYGYSGSAGFGQLYLYEWSGKDFNLLLSKTDVENTAEFKDLDNDGIKELIYNFKQIKWDREEHEIYKWNNGKMELVLN